MEDIFDRLARKQTTATEPPPAAPQSDAFDQAARRPTGDAFDQAAKIPQSRLTIGRAHDEDDPQEAPLSDEARAAGTQSLTPVQPTFAPAVPTPTGPTPTERIRERNRTAGHVVTDLELTPVADAAPAAAPRPRPSPSVVADATRIPTPPANAGTNEAILERGLHEDLAPMNAAAAAPTSLAGRAAQGAFDMATHPVETAKAVVTALPAAGFTLGKFAAQEERKQRGDWQGPDAISRREAAFNAGQLIAGGFADAALPFLDKVFGAAMRNGIQAALTEGRSPTQALILGFGARTATHAAVGAGVGAAFSPDDPEMGALLGAAIGGIHAGISGQTVQVPTEEPPAAIPAERQLPSGSKPPSARASVRSTPRAGGAPDYSVESPGGNSAALVEQDYLPKWDEKTMGTKPTRAEYEQWKERAVSSMLDDHLMRAAKGEKVGGFGQSPREGAESAVAAAPSAPARETTRMATPEEKGPEPRLSIPPADKDIVVGQPIPAEGKRFPATARTIAELAGQKKIPVDDAVTQLRTANYDVPDEAIAAAKVEMNEPPAATLQLDQKGPTDDNAKGLPATRDGSSSGNESETNADTAEPKRQFSSTQLNLPDEHAQAIKDFAAKIPDADLAGDGREDKPHVTVKYGLHGEDPDAVRELLANQPPITVKLGKTSMFPAGESGNGDVVKADVDSPELHALNKKIADALPHTDTHPDYKPHATIAYVKPGEGKKYVGDSSLAGRTMTIDHLTFSGKNGKMVEIPLTGGAAPALRTAGARASYARDVPAPRQMILRGGGKVSEHSDADSGTGGLPIAVDKSDIPYERALDAYRWNSMSPDRRAAQEQTEYVRHITAVHDNLKQFATTPESRQVLADHLTRYKDGYLRRALAVLSAQSRTASPMVTGPANFPTARNRKALDSEATKRTDLIEWSKRAQSAMWKALAPAGEGGPISSDDPEAITALKKKVEVLTALQERMKAANKIVKKFDVSAEERTKQVEALGFTADEAKEIVTPTHSWQGQGFPSYRLQNNLATIKTAQARIEDLTKRRAGSTAEYPFDGGRVVENVEDNRVQLHFDAKPAPEMIQKLKSMGFKWAPSVGAWQRQLTNNALYAVTQILGQPDMFRRKPVAAALPATATEPSPIEPVAEIPDEAPSSAPTEFDERGQGKLLEAPRRRYATKPGAVSDKAAVQSLGERFPSVLADINPSSLHAKTWTVDHVEVPKGERNAGVGSAFMKALTELADQRGIRLTLTPDDSFGATSVGRLKKFYGRFGFKKNRSSFEISDSMIREAGANVSPETEAPTRIDQAKAPYSAKQAAKFENQSPSDKLREDRQDAATSFGSPDKKRTMAELVAKVADAGLPTSEERLRSIAPTKTRQPWIDLRGRSAVNLSDLARMLTPFRHPGMEKFHVILMDDDGTILSHTAETAGALTWSTFSPAQTIVDRAKRLGATSAVISHNHPSGDPTPSDADKYATGYLGSQLQNAGIRLHGHLVIDHEEVSWITPGESGDFDVAHLHVPGGEQVPWVTAKQAGRESIEHPDQLGQLVRDAVAPDALSLVHLDAQNRIVALEPRAANAADAMDRWLDPSFRAHRSAGGFLIAPAAVASTIARRLMAAQMLPADKGWGYDVLDVLAASPNPDGTLRLDSEGIRGRYAPRERPEDSAEPRARRLFEDGASSDESGRPSPAGESGRVPESQRVAGPKLDVVRGDVGGRQPRRSDVELAEDAVRKADADWEAIVASADQNLPADFPFAFQSRRARRAMQASIDAHQALDDARARYAATAGPRRVREPRRPFATRAARSARNVAAGAAIGASRAEGLLHSVRTGLSQSVTDRNAPIIREHPELARAIASAQAMSPHQAGTFVRQLGERATAGLTEQQKADFGKKILHDNLVAEAERKAAQADELEAEPFEPEAPKKSDRGLWYSRTTEAGQLRKPEEMETGPLVDELHRRADNQITYDTDHRKYGPMSAVTRRNAARIAEIEHLLQNRDKLDPEDVWNEIGRRRAEARGDEGDDAVDDGTDFHFGANAGKQSEAPTPKTSGLTFDLHEPPPPEHPAASARAAAENFKRHADAVGKTVKPGIEKEAWFQKALKAHLETVQPFLDRAAELAGVNTESFRKPSLGAYMRLVPPDRLSEPLISRAQSIAATEGAGATAPRTGYARRILGQKGGVLASSPLGTESPVQGPANVIREEGAASAGAQPGTKQSGSAKMATGSARAYSSDYLTNLVYDAADKVSKAAHNQIFSAIAQDAASGAGGVEELPPDKNAPPGKSVVAFNDSNEIVDPPPADDAMSPTVRRFAVPKEVGAALDRYRERPATSTAGGRALRNVAGAITKSVLMNPLVAGTHTLSLASSVGTGIPAGAGPVRTLATGVPGVKVGSTLARMKAIDFDDPAIAKRLTRLAFNGALRLSEDRQGGIMNAGHHFLFGPKGMDTRARLVASMDVESALAKAGITPGDPRFGGLERKYVVEHAGNYVGRNQGTATKWLQDNGIAPFIAINRAKLGTSLKALVGSDGTIDPSAARRLGIGWRGPLGAAAAIAAAGYLLSGHTPDENAQGKEGDLALGVYHLPDGSFRYYRGDPKEAAKLFGKGTKEVYLRRGIIDPASEAALRLLQPLVTAHQGDKIHDVLRAAVNTALGFIGPAAGAAFGLTTGRQMYMDQEGNFATVEEPELPGNKTSRIKNRVVAATRNANAAAALTLPAQGDQTSPTLGRPLVNVLTEGSPTGRQASERFDVNSVLDDRVMKIYRESNRAKRQEMADAAVKEFADAVYRGAMIRRQLQQAVVKAGIPNASQRKFDVRIRGHAPPDSVRP